MTKWALLLAGITIGSVLAEPLLRRVNVFSQRRLGERLVLSFALTAIPVLILERGSWLALRRYADRQGAIASPGPSEIESEAASSAVIRFIQGISDDDWPVIFHCSADQRGTYALDWLAQRLSGEGAASQRSGFFYLAIESDCSEAIIWLYDCGSTLDAGGGDSISMVEHVAIRSRSLEPAEARRARHCFLELLRAKAPCREEGRELLLRSYEGEHIFDYNLLLEASVDPNCLDRNGMPLLLRACADSDKEDWVRLLLEHGADPNVSGPNGENALNLLAGGDSPTWALLQTLGLFIEKGADLRLSQEAVHIILHSGRVELLRPIIGKPGVEVDQPDREGLTPLIKGVRHIVLEDDVERVALLLQGGADPDQLCPDRTPVLVTCCEQVTHVGNHLYERAIELLLEAGADPNRRAPNGTGALHLLAQHCPATAARLIPKFLAAHCDLSARDQHGKTVLDIAREGNHEGLIQALQGQPNAE